MSSRAFCFLENRRLSQKITRHHSKLCVSRDHQDNIIMRNNITPHGPVTKNVKCRKLLL